MLKWMQVTGYIFVAVAAIYFLFKLYVAYDTRGGEEGMVPVLDGAIFPPLCATAGLYFASSDWPGWLFGAIWLSTTLVAVSTIFGVSKLRDRQH